MRPGGKQTEGDFNYAHNTPADREHNPVWQNYAFYEEPIRDDASAHTLYHVPVPITYSPDLPQDEVERLRDLAQSEEYVLVSPYPDLDSPVVASAWGKQLKLESAEDPDLEQFIGAYSQGPQTPEPGAACTGGIGNPV